MNTTSATAMAAIATVAAIADRIVSLEDQEHELVRALEFTTLSGERVVIYTEIQSVREQRHGLEDLLRQYNDMVNQSRDGENHVI